MAAAGISQCGAAEGRITLPGDVRPPAFGAGAEGRKPYSLLGGNIGARKRIVIIYTERLIAYVNGYPLEG